jgi:hypothetical protein
MTATTFFKDDGDASDISIDVIVFEKILIEFANSYNKNRLISKMKEVYRNRELLLDFMCRMNVDLRYLITLTYMYEPKIITPQLAKVLQKNIKDNPIYPRWE